MIKKNLTRLIAVAMLVVMVAGVTACEKKNPDNNTVVNETNSETTKETEDVTKATVEVEIDGEKRLVEVGTIIEGTDADGNTVKYEVMEDGLGIVEGTEETTVAESNSDSNSVNSDSSNLASNDAEDSDNGNNTSQNVPETPTQSEAPAPTSAPYVEPATEAPTPAEPHEIPVSEFNWKIGIPVTENASPDADVCPFELFKVTTRKVYDMNGNYAYVPGFYSLESNMGAARKFGLANFGTSGNVMRVIATYGDIGRVHYNFYFD